MRANHAGKIWLALKRRTGAILDAPVIIFIHPANQTDIFPAFDPSRCRLFICRADIAGLIDSLDKIDTRKSTDRRSGCVEQRNKDQRITGGTTRISHFRDGEKAHNHMRQASRANHQRQRDGENINHGFLVFRIGLKTQLYQCGVEFLQNGHATGPDLAAQSQLRHRIAGNQHGNKYGRHQIGENQHTILRDLRIGDALHAAQHGIKEHHAHANQHTHIYRNVEKTRKHHTNAPHLTGHIGEGNHNQANHRHQSRQLGIIAFADKIRHGELPEFPQIGRQQ